MLNGSGLLLTIYKEEQHETGLTVVNVVKNLYSSTTSTATKEKIAIKNSILCLKYLKFFEFTSCLFILSHNMVMIIINIFKVISGSPYIFALITPAPHIAPGIISESLSIVNVKKGRSAIFINNAIWMIVVTR